MSLYSFVSTLKGVHKRLIFLGIDLMMGPIALVCTLALLGELALLWAPDGTAATLLGFSSLLCASSANVLGLHHLRLNSYEASGLMRTAMLALVTAGACSSLSLAMSLQWPSAVFTIFALTLFSSVAMSRILLRSVLTLIYRNGPCQSQLIIYGAGKTGLQLAAALHNTGTDKVVAFVDDDPNLQNLNLMGATVFPSQHIEKVIARKGVTRVVLAMPSTKTAKQAKIAAKLRALGCDVETLPSYNELVTDKDLSKRYKPVPLDVLLGRNDLGKDLPAVASAYQGSVVMITGAGGSIGSELCRQLMDYSPIKLVLVDHCELALYNVDRELRERAPDLAITPVLGSVCDQAYMADIMAEHGVETVLHAAAYKHVPMVECNEIAGLQNNVVGTKALADAAITAGVKQFILVSSDKAVRPANIMGASKRLAEMAIQDLATRSETTRFSMVRFGNVLGSSGSVIPLFEKQIAQGGPVTVTHKDVARYFMTISEAARLVLLAGTFSRGGDVFVLDMGELVPIQKLAQQMIEGSGLTVQNAQNPDGDIAIEITGLRPGEKMIEELLISPDMLTTPHPKIMRAQEICPSEFEVATALKDLHSCIQAGDRARARALVTRWVEPQQPLAIALAT